MIPGGVELIENVGLSFLCGRTKNNLNMLCADAYFFENRETSLRFQKYLDTCGRGLNILYICNSFGELLPIAKVTITR